MLKKSIDRRIKFEKKTKEAKKEKRETKKHNLKERWIHEEIKQAKTQCAIAIVQNRKSHIDICQKL